jgi:protein TonB
LEIDVFGIASPVRKAVRRSTFTIYHGLAVSLALHSAVILPFVFHLSALAPENPPMLVVELQGAAGQYQAEQKVQQETTGSASEQLEMMPPKPQNIAEPDDEPNPDTANHVDVATPPPAEAQPTPQAVQTKSEGADANNVKGGEERQDAQTISVESDPGFDRIRDYVKHLTKRVQSKLVYPSEGRRAGLHGTATVSFAILATGQIRPDTLKIVASSGQAELDASALKTVRASVPFKPPPKEMTIAISVAFERKPRY